ncbi:hypothetical protein ACSBR1_001052 [Camellia fascicularis]
MGSIPFSIGYLGNLTILKLYRNQLSESIAQEVGLLRSLNELDFSNNNLTGSIPFSIGNLGNLTLLHLCYNNLAGHIPSTIGKLKNLQDLSLCRNQISGSIPPELGKLNSLIWLGLLGNKLTGSIPPELENLTHLQLFDIYDNKITGFLPQNICLGGSLTELVASKNLIGRISKSLKNCKSLTQVRLQQNQLTGNISEDFGILPNLVYIDLSYNNFYGELSQNWGRCHNLTSLKISENKISGKILPELGGATQLQVLDLSSNNLVGEIPKNLENLNLLFDLTLSNNRLSGNIPAELGSLSNLQSLNLATNKLSGSIPSQLGECVKLLNLNLSENLLSGGIRTEIGKLQFLQTLDLGNNSLTGEIPQSIGELQSLETLNLSIPSSFNGMGSLTSIDISYNHLEGPLPNTKAFQDAPFEAYVGNDGLCGNKTGSMPCSPNISNGAKGNKHNKILLLILVPVSGIISLGAIGSFLVLRKRVGKIANEPEGANNENLFAIWSYDGKMVYENIIEATEDFNVRHCIGVGGCGTVYKVELPSGQIVAVKKLHSSQDGELAYLRSFTSEIGALTDIRHRNIIKLYGFCSHPRHSYLVYEFLEGGSLDKILSNDETTLDFEWTKRVDVVSGLADALSYVHHDCLPPVIHRDISSKNILLDSEYVAHISDFGTARLLNPHSSNWTSFAGTFGYAAPVTAHDILLKDILDSRLPIPRTRMEKEVVLAAKLALACLHTSPQCRPTMRQVSVALSKQRPPLPNSFHFISLGQLFDVNHLTS